MNVTKDIIEYKRFTIPYRIYGSGKTCLLCINGAQMSMGIWKPFIRRFSHQYKVVIFDFPHQGAGKINSEPFLISFNEQIECVEQVIAQITDYDSLYIYGASWGAIMAAAYAANSPHKVDKLILGSCAVKGNEKLNDIIIKGINYYNNGESGRLGSLLIEGFGKSISPTLKKKIEQQFLGIDHRHLKAFYYQSSFVLNKKLVDLVKLSRISAPSLIVFGDDDKVSDLNDVYSLQSEIKNSRVTIVKGIGHFLHLEDSSVMDVYDKFLASDSTGTQSAKSSTCSPPHSLRTSQERLAPLISTKNPAPQSCHRSPSV